MSIGNKSRVKPHIPLNHTASEITSLTPRVEISVPTFAEIDALLDKITSVEMATKHTKMVQITTQLEADAAIEEARSFCIRPRTIYEKLSMRRYRAVAKAAIVCHMCPWEMLKSTCIKKGIKISERYKSEPSYRASARLMFGLESSADFSTLDKNLNTKDVGIYAGYLKACIKRLIDTPLHFAEDPEDKLVAMIASYRGLGNFARGEMPSNEESEEMDDSSVALVKTQAAQAIAASTSTRDVPKTNTTSVTAPSVASMPTNSGSTDDDEPEYWPLIPQFKIDGSEPDKPRIARTRILWEQKWVDQLKKAPNLQEIVLMNPPVSLKEGSAFLFGSVKAGKFKILAMSNLHFVQGDIIRHLVERTLYIAPVLVKALSDLAATKVLPSFMMEHAAWDDHLTAVISRSQLSLAAADTFLISTRNRKSGSITRCKVKSPATKGSFFPLALQADDFGAVTMWESHGIGGAIADDTLVPSSNGEGSYELAVDWCFASELLSFDPIQAGVWQADFDFGTFQPEYEAIMNSRELTMLQFEVLAPWIEAFGKRKLAQRKNVQAVRLHLDDNLAIEFNQSSAGGVERSYAMQTRKKQVRTLSLAFDYDDLLPVLCFLTHENVTTVNVVANSDGIAFYVDLGYASYSTYVPALTADGKTKDVLFTQFP